MYSRLIKDFVPITATCKGDYDDPLLKPRLLKFKRTLQTVLKTGGRCVLVDEVTPWNSIRIKLRLSHDASLRLRELAQQRDQQLAELGILSLQFEGDNESFTIVDVPSSSGALNVNDVGASSSYSIGPNALSFLVGDSQRDYESKPLAGTRRALPHSGGGLPDAEFSSSCPKIAKRASGIRRPRGSRTSRGSRGGGSAGHSLSSIGLLETAISPTLGNLATISGASGCEQPTLSNVSQQQNEMNESKEAGDLTGHNSRPSVSPTNNGELISQPAAELMPSFEELRCSTDPPYIAQVLPPVQVQESEPQRVDETVVKAEGNSSINNNLAPVSSESVVEDSHQISPNIPLTAVAAHSLSVVNGCSVSGDVSSTTEAVVVVVEMKDSRTLPPIIEVSPSDDNNSLVHDETKFNGKKDNPTMEVDQVDVSKNIIKQEEQVMRISAADDSDARSSSPKNVNGNHDDPTPQPTTTISADGN